jgi:translocation and assembly module TamB
VTGPRDDLSVAVQLQAPQRASFVGKVLALSSGKPTWQGNLQSEKIDLSALGLRQEAAQSAAAPTMSLPFASAQATISGRGDFQHAEITGEFALDEQRFRIQEAKIAFADQWQFKPVSIELLAATSAGNSKPGLLRFEGHWPLNANSKLPGALDLQWQAFTLPSAWGWPDALLMDKGQARIEQTDQHLAIILDTALRRAKLNAQLHAEVQLQNSLANKQIDITTLRLSNASGQLQASGVVQQIASSQAQSSSSAARDRTSNESSSSAARDRTSNESNWRWQLKIKADQLNPALLLPEWPGLLAVDADSQGQWRNGVPDGSLDLRALSGELRGQPIDGKGSLRLQRSWQPEGKLELRWGANFALINGQSDGAIDAQIEWPQLAQILPDATGSLDGSLQMQSKAGRHQISGTLRAANLSWHSIAAQQLQADIAVAEQADAPLRVVGQARDVQFGTQQFALLDVDLQGTQRAHQLSLRLQSPDLAISTNASGGWVKQNNQSGNWQGVVNALEARLIKLGLQATLSSPSKLAVQTGNGLSIDTDRACFAAIVKTADLADICASGRYASVGASALQFELSKVRVDALQNIWQTPRIKAQGLLQGGGQLAFQDGALTSGAITLDPSQALRLTIDRPDAPDAILQFQRSTIAITAAPVSATSPEASLLLNADLALNDGTAIKLDAMSLIGEALSGSIQFDWKDLAMLDGYLISVAEPKGSMAGTINLTGTRSAPEFAGQVLASNLGMELPALGLVLKGGKVSLTGSADRVVVDGQIESGEGRLQVSGYLSPFTKAKADLILQGSRVLIADVPSARVLASPNLRFTHDGELLRIKGVVDLPEANVNLARLEGSSSASSDVVVIDDPKSAQGVSTRADVTVSLGENVAIRGFGLNGKAAGTIKIRERPNKRSTARGEFNVTGTYKAYGQNLQIERGKLLYSSSPLNDPSLEIRAFRQIERIKAGVRVQGTATQPALSIWSDPAMEQSDALFYLIAGRPLRGATRAEQAQVSQAAGALQTAGGNLIAQGVGQRIGLELGVETLSDAGGTVFTAGKYLSPSLYVGYGKGLVNAQTLLIVRYKLSNQYEFEAISGREQKIGVNYRNER